MEKKKVYEWVAVDYGDLNEQHILQQGTVLADNASQAEKKGIMSLGSMVFHENVEILVRPFCVK